MDIGEETGKKRQIKRDSVEPSSNGDDKTVVEKTKKLRKHASVSATSTTSTSGSEEMKDTAARNAGGVDVTDKRKVAKTVGISAVAVASSVAATSVEGSANDATANGSTSNKEEEKTEQNQLDEITEARKDSNESDSKKTDAGDSQATQNNAPQPQQQQQQLPMMTRKLPTGEGQDLESALTVLMGASEGQQERISDHSYLTFRIGHAGDASLLALWYSSKNRKATLQQSHVDDAPGSTTSVTTAAAVDDRVQPQRVEEKEAQQVNNHKDDGAKSEAVAPSPAVQLEQEAASSLELWLAEGLGNEDMPPSLFALLAHVNYDKQQDDKVEDEGDEAGNTTAKASRLAAVALLTVAWENSSRVLRVEWLQVDYELDNATLVERRMWLRLAALSLMTACEMYVVAQPQDNRTLASSFVQGVR